MAHVVVLVLGDLGRSPRMQYHALSISSLDSVKQVTLLGYEGEKCMTNLDGAKKIRFVRMKVPESSLLRRSVFVHALWKGLALMFLLFRTFLELGSYDVVLIQNPPCLPAAITAVVLSFLNRSVVFLDWHNLGFKMFEEKLGPKHVLVKLSKLLEGIVAYFCAFHCCVSRTMAAWLADHFHLKVAIVHDKPGSIFDRNGTSIDRKHALFRKLKLTDEELFTNLIQRNAHLVSDKDGRKDGLNTDRTIQCSQSSNGGAVLLRDDAARLIVSSTSWTEDEDFNALLDALVLLDKKLAAIDNTSADKVNNRRKSGTEPHPLWPDRVVVLVTGKGPMKQAFIDRVSQLESDGLLNYVAARTVWLEPVDYPTLMGSADLGVSLHTSTSGLDLPMKVLDMFGSGVPVCAVGFPAIGELVIHGTNGTVFETSEELSGQLHGLLTDANYAITPTKDEYLGVGHDTGMHTVVDTSLADRKSIGGVGKQDDAMSVSERAKQYPTCSRVLSQMRVSAAHIGTWDANWDATMRQAIELAIQSARSRKLFAHNAFLLCIIALLVGMLISILHREKLSGMLQ